MQGTFTVTTEAAPEVVWPYVADVRKHAYSPKPFGPSSSG